MLTQVEASAGYRACRYRDQHAARGSCTAAKVTINDQPQAYTSFQRWVVESTQTAGQSGRPGLAPVQVDAGIGIESDWIPANLDFEAARADRWVAVFLTCPVPGSVNLRLAEDLARAAMSG